MRGCLFVTTQGATIGKEGERVKIRTRANEIITDLPASKIEMIIAIGGVNFTPEYVNLASRFNIETVFLTLTGQFKARLDCSHEKLVTVRLKQYEFVKDEEKNLKLASSFVSGKIQNMRTILRRYKKRGRKINDEVLIMMKAYSIMAKKTENHNELLGVEGCASALYFQNIQNCLNYNLGFHKRVRRPPTDPVNALLSFGYSILYRYVCAAVRLSGLDPYLGVLHFPKDRRQSLALDLMEEWRSIVVDSVVIRMVNQLEVSEDDFIRSASSGGMIMNKKLLGKYITKLGNRLNTEISMKKNSKSYPIKKLMIKQALLCRKIMEGKEEEYISFRNR